MGVKGLTPKHQYAHSPQCPIFISYDKLSRRISLTIKTFLSCQLFFLFSWPHCLIQWQYSTKICQNCQINSADYAYINLTRNRQIPPSWFCFEEYDLNSPKSSNPWTFTLADKILSNLPFLLLHAFLDICDTLRSNWRLITLRA